MIIDTIEGFLPEGATKPFAAITDSGERVIVKALLKPEMGKLLLNEYISGSLANRINLPWPQTSLATLSLSSEEWLQKQSIQVFCPNCVATNFIDNLTMIPWPKPPEPYSRWDWDSLDQLPEVNKNHLMRYFDHPENQSNFYGRALFELWLFLQDNKYDTLFSLPNRTPFFLDGSHAFGGSDWELDELDYSKPKCFPQSPYLQGILTNRELFVEWFNRIEAVENDYIRSIINAIPASWETNQPQLDFILELITAKRKDFLQAWKHELLENPY